MPRFYLHIRDGEHLTEDLEGSDVPSLDAARAEALEAAREVLAEKVRTGKLVDGQRFEIIDENGNLKAIVPLRDALRLE